MFTTKFDKTKCFESLYDLWNYLYDLYDQYNYSSNEINIYFDKIIQQIQCCLYHGKKKLAEKMINYLIVICFDTRNQHCGLGLKKASYDLYFKLLEIIPDTMISLLPEWSKWGYWKDYQNLYTICQNKLFLECEYSEVLLLRLQGEIKNLWISQLLKDYDHVLQKKWNKISFCAKYFPKENKSLDKKCKIFSEIATKMFEQQNYNRNRSQKLLRKMIQKIIKSKQKDVNKQQFDFETHKNIQQVHHIYNLYPYDIELFRKIMEHPLYSTIITRFSMVSKNKDLIYDKLLLNSTTIPEPIVISPQISDYEWVESQENEEPKSLFRKFLNFFI